MLRLLAPGLLGLVLFGLWVYCIFDVIASNDALVRNLPKLLWLAIVVFIPTVGSLAWLGLGRPINAGWQPGDTRSRPTPAPRGPEDRPDFGREEELRRREEELRRREEELRRQEEGPEGDR